MEIVGGCSDSAEAAGTRLTQDADRYEEDDLAAARALDQSVPEGGTAPPVLPAGPGGALHAPVQPWSGEPEISTAPWPGGGLGPLVVPA